MIPKISLKMFNIRKNFRSTVYLEINLLPPSCSYVFRVFTETNYFSQLVLKIYSVKIVSHPIQLNFIVRLWFHTLFCRNAYEFGNMLLNAPLNK